MTDPLQNRYMRKPDVIRASLQAGLSAQIPTFGFSISRNDALLDDSPKFHAPIYAIDHLLGGGGYGVTCIAGMPKLGKSTLGLSWAIESAATQKWRVVYFDAENDDVQARKRAARYLLAHPAAEDAIPNLEVVQVYPGFNSESMVEEAISCVRDEEDMRLLIVIDSVNTIANNSGGEYFQELHQLIKTVMVARRISNGDVSALVVSELNSKGQAKGGQAEYWSDVVIRMRSVTGRANAVNIDVKYSRETAEGDLGVFARDWRTGSFDRIELDQGPKK